MEALASYDPDEPLKVVKPERRKEGERCPTCLQKIEKPVKRDEIWKVIRIFKMASYHDQDDKRWDTLYYPRYMKPAKELISYLGSWELAADCIQEIYENFTGLGFTVTFETILKHASEWKKNYLEKHPVVG